MKEKNIEDIINQPGSPLRKYNREDTQKPLKKCNSYYNIIIDNYQGTYLNSRF